MHVTRRLCRLGAALFAVPVVVTLFAFGATSAQASGWSLTVSPLRVAQGGTVSIRTTIDRRCGLTVLIAGRRYRYTMRAGRTQLTMPRNETPGPVRVTVTCAGRVATNVFTVIGSELAQRTPVTVANVCALDSAFGTVHYATLNGYPSAYWADGSRPTLLAFSIDGNSSVDVAAVVNPQGTGITYFARCSWSRWLSVAQFQAAQEQQGVSATQASSFGYLVQEQTNDAIYEEDSDWFTPSAGWQECPTNPYDECDYQDTYDGY